MSRISGRMHDVAEKLKLGLSNPEIAVDLGISERTVKAYMHRWFDFYNITGGCPRIKLLRILCPPQPGDTAPVSRLTSKELEVARLTVEGIHINRIAEAMGTTVYMVKNHRRAIYNKTGSWGRTDLAARLSDALYRPQGSAA
jgi:DNA-binding NarL/FixJ family response regulator